MGGITAEEFVAFHRGVEGADDGAGGRVTFFDVHDEGAVEAVILEEGLVLVVPFALEGAVLVVFPGPGTDIDLAVVEEDRIGAGFREDESFALLVQLLLAFLVAGLLEPFREVAAIHVEPEVQDRQVTERKGEIAPVEDPVTAQLPVDLRFLDRGCQIGMDREGIPAAAVDENLGHAAAEEVDDEFAESLQEIGPVDEREVSVDPDVVQVQVAVALGAGGFLGDDIFAIFRQFNGLDGAGSICDLVFTEHLVGILSGRVLLVTGGQCHDEK